MVRNSVGFSQILSSTQFNPIFTAFISHANAAAATEKEEYMREKEPVGPVEAEDEIENERVELGLN